MQAGAECVEAAGGAKDFTDGARIVVRACKGLAGLPALGGGVQVNMVISRRSGVSQISCGPAGLTPCFGRTARACFVMHKTFLERCPDAATIRTQPVSFAK